MLCFRKTHFVVRAPSCLRLAFVLACTLVTTIACDSATPPPSTTPSSTPNTSTKTGTTTKSGSQGGNSGSPDVGGFDLCSDGLLAHELLQEFSAYTKAVCTASQLQALRSKENIYSGGDNKIIEKTKSLGDLKSSFSLMTSAVYKADIEEYWSLLQLQFLKPKVFSDNFERDPDTKVSEVQPANDKASVAFRYENSSGEGGKVDYLAKTQLIELSSGLAYVTATKLTKSNETLTDLKGLIIVHKIDDESIEVFSTSFQEYSHASGQGATYYDRALRSMRAEQKRAWTNAANAAKAKDLLDN